jgi:CheY-like chemotaxis protein
VDTEHGKTRRGRSKARILVVDDQPEVASVIRAVLVREGFDAEMAFSGTAALDSLMSGHRFDLIITDVRMPEMDGFELLRRVRKSTKNLPVILMTGQATPEHRLRALEQGASGYLSKPFEVKALLKSIRQALEDGE